MTRRNIWLVITALALGPLVGAVLFIVSALLTGGAGPDAVPVGGILYYSPVILTAAYVLGALPALVSAIVMAVLTRFIPRRGHRLLAATVVGGLGSAIGGGVIVFSDGASSADDGVVLGTITLAGAIAGLACMALVEHFHPLPPAGATKPGARA